MKKIWMLAAFLLVLASFGESKIVYNNWAKADLPFAADNLTYKVTYVKETNSTIIYLPEGIVTVINANDMNCTYKWIYSVCQTKQKFEKGGFEIPPDAHEKNMNVSLFLIINRTEGDVSVKKTFSGDFYFGGKITVNTVLERSGLGATGVSFYDYFPEGAILSVEPPCKKENDAVIWSGELNTTSKATCTYHVLSMKEMTNNGSLSYTLMDKKTEKPLSWKINVSEAPFSITLYYDNKTRVPDEIFNLSINIRPKEDFEMKEILVSFPEGFNKKEAILLGEDLSGGLLSNKLFKKSGSFFFYANASTNKSGKHKIDVSFKYDINGQTRTLWRSFYVEYAADGLSVELIETGEEKKLRIINKGDAPAEGVLISAEGISMAFVIIGGGFYEDILLGNFSGIINISYSLYGQKTYANFSVPAKRGALEKEIKKDGEEIPLVSMALIAACALCCVFIVLAIIKSLPKKSRLDKEIEDIKKEGEKEK